MISGTCDAIFVKNCLDFLLQVQIEHHQFTDNSAARQLISKQGVGRICHLSAKLLWLQDLVSLGEIQVSQVPTFWNFSDVGTKNLSKSRLYFLLCGIGAIDPVTAEPIGQEEYHAAAEQDENRKALSKLGKAIKRISLILGVQRFESLAAEAKVVNMCPKEIKAVERDSNSSGLWLAICLLCFFVVILAVAFYFVWKRFNKRLSEQEAVVKQMQQDLFHCWNQVADEDGYIAQQETRINELHNRLMMHDGRLVEQSNEHSMLHDYICGLHYGLVESGGFLRFGFGLTTDQFTSLAMHERANLVAYGAMGSEQYLRLVRQRARAEHAETTDMPISHGADSNVGNDGEQGESETSDDDEMDEGGEQQPPPMTQLIEDVKEQQAFAIQRGDWRDAAQMQSLILAMLTAVRGGIDEGLVNEYKERSADLFLRLAEHARATDCRHPYSMADLKQNSETVSVETKIFWKWKSSDECWNFAEREGSSNRS